jgi:hypothetical protein
MFILNREALKTVEDVADVLELLGVVIMNDHPLAETHKRLLLEYVPPPEEES